VTTTIELAGLELYGYHGVLEEERRRGQPFVLHVALELAAHPAADRIEDAVDYREVAACVRHAFEAEQVQLLETLAASIADALLARFPLAAARVRISKPQVRLDPPVASSSVTVERRR
jgi:dihydroneopterin aldolase